MLTTFLFMTNRPFMAVCLADCSQLTRASCWLQQDAVLRRNALSDEDEGLCSICMDRPLEAQIAGCEHQVSCEVNHVMTVAFTITNRMRHS